MNSRRQKIMAALAVIFMVAVASLSATPKPGKLAGHITDARTQAGLAGVSVVVGDNLFRTTSDNNGAFEIARIPGGTYVVRFSRSGYESREMAAVTIFSGQIRELNVELVPLGKAEAGKVAADAENEATSAERILRKLSGGTAEGKLAPGAVTGTTQSIVRTEKDKDYRDQSNPQIPYGSDYREPEINLPPFDMFFRDYGTNGFTSTRRDNQSTFALDVDDASYTLIRRYLTEGNLPPQDAVRVEEFINHFDYGYNPPSESRFRIFTELGRSPFDERLTFLKVGIKGQELGRRERRPLNLTVVLDISGSMGYDNRLELVKRSIGLLLDQLHARDQVAVVAYGSQASVVVKPTSASQRDLIMSRVNALRAHGSTYAEAGLTLGYQLANRQYDDDEANVVILCSDGVANVGRTSPEAIMKQISRFANQGITLSTFGFGMGNYNDVLLEQLARKGNGKYAYVNDVDEARTQFVEELSGNTQLLARDVKVQVTFDPEQVAAYRLIGYENRAVADRKFRDNRQDGGEVGSGHEITALYELQLTSRRVHGELGTIAVRWKDVDRTEVTEVEKGIEADGAQRSFASLRPEFRLAVVAARFAELLKGSPYATNSDFDDLERMAWNLARQRPSEQTRELADLIKRAGELSFYHTEWNE